MIKAFSYISGGKVTVLFSVLQKTQINLVFCLLHRTFAEKERL